MSKYTLKDLIESVLSDFVVKMLPKRRYKIKVKIKKNKGGKMSIVLMCFLIMAGMWVINIVGFLKFLGDILDSFVRRPLLRSVLGIGFLSLIGLGMIMGISVVGYNAWKLTYYTVWVGYRIPYKSLIPLLVILYTIYFVVGWVMFKFSLKEWLGVK